MSENENTCDHCMRQPVCLIYIFTKKFLEEQFTTSGNSGSVRRKQPFQPENIAKICEFYDPALGKLIIEA